MSWITHLFASSIGRKFTIALTGLFLCMFLVIHLIGNLQLIFGDRDAFNEYTYFMTHFKPIKIASYFTYFAILYHAIGALVLTFSNRGARPVRYAENRPGNSSTWSSRNMAFLGVVTFVYIVVHLQNFWYKLKFGEVESYLINGVERKDLYSVVLAGFQQEWLVGLYVVAMAALAFHLLHGFQSGFQTLGLNHPKYTPIIEGTGKGFGVLVPLLYAIIPIYVYFAF